VVASLYRDDIEHAAKARLTLRFALGTYIGSDYLRVGTTGGRYGVHPRGSGLVLAVAAAVAARRCRRRSPTPCPPRARSKMSSFLNV